MGAARLQEKMALRPCSARLDPSFGRAWARKHARLGPNLRNPERNSCPNADSAWAGLGLGLRSRIQDIGLDFKHSFIFYKFYIAKIIIVEPSLVCRY